MQNNKETISIPAFVHINHKKFKDITVVLRMLFPISAFNATCAALLMYIMEDRSIMYPSKQAMLQIKDHLYGTTFSSGVIGYGKNMVLQLASKVMDPQFSDDKKLLESHSEWLYQVIHNPLINEETLKEAKAQVLSSLIRDLDQPSKYAQIKAFEALGPEHVLSINLDGDLATLANITVVDVQTFFDTIMNQSYKSMYVIGNIDQERAQALYKNKFIQNNHYYPMEVIPIDIAPLNDIEETKDTNQSQLVKLFKTNVSMNHPLYMANRVAIAALGQLPTSYLFKEIREKRSLCYSIYSQYIAFDGICVVKTGIDQANIDEVHQLINEQVVALKNIDQELLKQAKSMLINAINNSDDELLSYVNLHYSYALLEKEFHKENVIQEIEATTLLDITQAISLWEDLLLFVVKGVKQ